MAADPVKMYLNDVFTVTVNMAGLPGIAVPAGLDAKGLPLGLQLIGRPFDEETLFQTAAVIEQAAGTFSAREMVVGSPRMTRKSNDFFERIIRKIKVFQRPCASKRRAAL